MDIIYNEYLYKELLNITIDTPPTSQSFGIFKCSMEITDAKTIIEEDIACDQQTHTKRGDDTHMIIPPFNTEDLPHLVMNFIGNTRVIDLTMTILHTTNIRDITITPLSIVPCPRELTHMKIVHEMVKIPLATHLVRNHQKRKLFARGQH